MAMRNWPLKESGILFSIFCFQRDVFDVFESLLLGGMFARRLAGERQVSAIQQALYNDEMFDSRIRLSPVFVKSTNASSFSLTVGIVQHIIFSIFDPC